MSNNAAITQSDEDRRTRTVGQGPSDKDRRTRTVGGPSDKEPEGLVERVAKAVIVGNWGSHDTVDRLKRI
jgi:hypothetical protein